MESTDLKGSYSYSCVRCGHCHSGAGIENQSPIVTRICENCGHDQLERELMGSDIAWIVGQMLHMPLIEVQAAYQPDTTREEIRILARRQMLEILHQQGRLTPWEKSEWENVHNG